MPLNLTFLALLSFGRSDKQLNLSQPNVRGVNFTGKVLAQLKREWGGLATILALELLSMPLALLGPVGIKIAIDNAISGKPVPQILQLLLPHRFLQSTADVLLVAVFLQIGVVLLIQARWFCSYLLKIRCGERMVIGSRGIHGALYQVELGERVALGQLEGFVRCDFGTKLHLAVAQHGSSYAVEELDS